MKHLRKFTTSLGLAGIALCLVPTTASAQSIFSVASSHQLIAVGWNSIDSGSSVSLNYSDAASATYVGPNGQGTAGGALDLAVFGSTIVYDGSGSVSASGWNPPDQPKAQVAANTGLLRFTLPLGGTVDLDCTPLVPPQGSEVTGCIVATDGPWGSAVYDSRVHGSVGSVNLGPGTYTIQIFLELRIVTTPNPGTVSRSSELHARIRVSAGSDTDGDGVEDIYDGHPCDASAAGSVFYPAEGIHGLFLFEDFWPQPLDEDFNDLVVSVNHDVRVDPQGRTTRILATLNVLALGGAIDIGLGVRLPIARTGASQVSLRVEGRPTRILAPSGADSDLVVLLGNSVRRDLLQTSYEGPVNADLALPTLPPGRMVLDVLLASPTPVDLSTAPFDFFIFRTADPSHEIHLPSYCGTAAMNGALFGTGIDGSDVGGGRCFVDRSGLPSGLFVPAAAAYPAEGVGIHLLYPGIVAFAASGGLAGKDYYLAPSSSFAYPGFPVPGFPSDPTLTTDNGCLP